jgi:hypothetical protein
VNRPTQIIDNQQSPALNRFDNRNGYELNHDDDDDDVVSDKDESTSSSSLINPNDVKNRGSDKRPPIIGPLCNERQMRERERIMDQELQGV